MYNFHETQLNEDKLFPRQTLYNETIQLFNYSIKLFHKKKKRVYAVRI